MPKDNSKDITFEQLMKRAAEVAKSQDAVLLEKSKERRRQEDERRRKEEHILMEKQRKERELRSKHQAMEQRQRQLLEKKQQHQSIRKPPPPPSSTVSRQKQQQQEQRRRPVNTTTKSTNSKKAPVASSLPLFEKKKPVHMSYEQLMEKAKEVSSLKKPSAPEKKVGYSSSTSTPDNGHHGPSKQLPSSSTASTASTLYLKRSNLPTKSKSTQDSSSSTMPARDRIRLEFNTPAQKMARTKRDRQSIEEIQRDIRHSKGKYSDDDNDDIRSNDKRYRPDTTTRRVPQQSSSKPFPPSSSYPASNTTRKQQTQQQRPNSMQSQQQQQQQQQPRGPIRMPFRRAVDPKRLPKRPHRPNLDYDDEDDDDLDSFIVEDDDGGYERSRMNDNDYSSEISKIFRYDRKRYANESVYSDDDMEANSMDVIREEKRSERLARREDQLEDQLEQERRKKRMAKLKGK